MPGIAGIISRRPPAECERSVKTMTATMRHESFHATGGFSAPESGVYAGWVAHENSFAADQVFFNDPKDIALVFSGECFPEPETKIRLKRNGQGLAADRGGWLVPLYEEQGEKFFGGLNGLFSGLLIDQRRDKVFLFNDRFGMERIYWHETADAFYFATEAKALLRILPELRAFDGEGVAQYLGVGCPIGCRSLFRGVQMLPGGALWTFENGKCRREKYFSPDDWESQPALPAEDFESRFQETFKSILPGYFESASRIGLALTGGFDTRMIMACRPGTQAKPVCYTFAGAHGKTLDDKIAMRVAAASGLEHHLLRLQPDFFSDFAAHADRTVYVTDGAFGILGAHEIYFHREARKLSALRLTGNYGSEVFRGISTFKPLGLSPELLSPYFAGAVNAAVSQLAGHRKHPGTFSIFKEIPWNLFGSVAAGRSQVTFRTPYLDNALVKLAYQLPVSIRKSSLPAGRLVRANSRILSEIPTDRGYAGNNSGPVFFCRRIFAEATFKVDYYHNEGLPHRLAPLDPVFKFAAAKLKLSGRHKYLHYGSWFRNGLAEYVSDALSSAKNHGGGFLDPHFLRKMGEQHLRGENNYAPEINAALTLEAIERLLFRELPCGF
jgi:asparagine synthase (glutamine-hydrolysing)